MPFTRASAVIYELGQMIGFFGAVKEGLDGITPEMKASLDDYQEKCKKFAEEELVNKAVFLVTDSQEKRWIELMDEGVMWMKKLGLIV